MLPYGEFDFFHMFRGKVKGVANRGSTGPASCVPAEFVKSNPGLKLGPRFYDDGKHLVLQSAASLSSTLLTAQYCNS